MEVLITDIILGNEQNHKYEIDLYTLEDERYSGVNYKYTNIISIRDNCILKMFFKIYNRITRILFKKIKRKSVYNLKTFRKLKKYNKKYDCILVENNMFLYYKINKLYNGKAKLFFHLHNDILDNARPKWLCEYILENCNKVITVSEYLKNRLESIKQNNKTEVLYNCVDLECFSDDKVEKNKIREKYNIKVDDTVFIYTGRIMKEKGVLELVKAFNKLSDEYEDITLIIVGNMNNNKSEYIKELKKYIENERIIVTGFVNPNDIAIYLKDSDIVVIPSKWEEPFGVVALEAMAMRKSIIATKSGGLIEPLNDKCAVIIEKDKNLIENIYDAMKELYNNKEKRKEIAENAYNAVINNKDFDIKNYYSNLIKIMDNK